MRRWLAWLSEWQLSGAGYLCQIASLLRENGVRVCLPVSQPSRLSF